MHICETADKKTAYNEVRLYCYKLLNVITCGMAQSDHIKRLLNTRRSFRLWQDPDLDGAWSELVGGDDLPFARETSSLGSEARISRKYFNATREPEVDFAVDLTVADEFFAA